MNTYRHIFPVFDGSKWKAVHAYPSNLSELLKFKFVRVLGMWFAMWVIASILYQIMC